MKWQALLVAVSVLGVVGCQKQQSDDNGQPQDLQSKVTPPYHENCPALSDYSVPNSTYVYSGTFDFSSVGGPTPNSAMCYSYGNLADRNLCSAYEYYGDAISFDPKLADPSNIASGEERLYYLQSALFYLRSAYNNVRAGLYDNSQCSQRSDPSYQQFMLATASEIVSLGLRIADEGRDVAVALSDGTRSKIRDYAELSAAVWGLPDVENGGVTTPGLRAEASALFLGVPWESLSSTIDIDPVLAPCTVDTEANDVASARALLQRYGVPVKLRIQEYTKNYQQYWNNPPTTGTYINTINEEVYYFDNLTSEWKICLQDVINASRTNMGLPSIEIDTLMDDLDVTDESLRKASKSLLEDQAVHAYSVHVVQLHSDCMIAKIDEQYYGETQVLLANSQVGTYAVENNEYGSYFLPTSEMLGIQGIITAVASLYDCLLPTVGSDCIYDDVSPLITQGSARDFLLSSRRTVDSQLGTSYIQYVHTYPSLRLQQTVPNTVPSLTVKMKNLGDMSDVQIFSVPANKSIYRGLGNDYYKLLICLYEHRGVSEDDDCTMQQYYREHYSQCDFTSSDSCTFDVPEYYTVSGQGYFWIPPRMFIASCSKTQPR